MQLQIKNNVNFTLNTKKAACVLAFFILSIVITALPILTIHFLTVDESFTLMIFVEFVFALAAYVFFLQSLPGFKIKVHLDRTSIKNIIIPFIIIALIQISVYFFRNSREHYETVTVSFMTLLTLIMVIPFYEELFYRGCLFGFLCFVYKKNLVIPSVITSLIFCLMHTQYYNFVDQSVLFIASLAFIYVRIETKGLFYSMLIHSGMNLIIVMLNIQNIYR